MQRPPAPPKYCVYCGGAASSRDHVIPRSLFTPPLPQMVTVPACSDCQRKKGYGDDDLAHFVAMDWAGSQHPEAFAQLVRAARATQAGYSKLGRAFTQGGWPRDLVTEAGIILGTVWESPIPDENRDMFRTLEYIVRGLHVVRNFRYDRKATPLDPACPVSVKGVDRLKAESIVRRLVALPHDQPTIMRNNIAMWMRFPPQAAGSSASLWLLVFNNQVCFLGATGTIAVAGT